MKAQTRHDLLTVMSSLIEDTVKEAIQGNHRTAQLLSAYAQDIVEILIAEGEAHAEN